MGDGVWERTLEALSSEVKGNDFLTWIKPLQAEVIEDSLVLYAPNRFIMEHVTERYQPRIRELVHDHSTGTILHVRLEVGAVQRQRERKPVVIVNSTTAPASVELSPTQMHSNLAPQYTFDNFVQGKSNQLAYAACVQVADQLGGSTYNPLFIYGPTALGKSHLMHALGNAIKQKHPGAKVLYRRSEAFVNDFVTALRNKVVNDFNRLYRSLDVLLIDDIHFFANKTASQEEFFHTFNSLLEGSRQIVLASDKYPKEISDVDDRLKSRLSWGLTIQVEPPELETRVAILLKKAEIMNVELPHSVAFFIAQQIQTNVRELEGALNRVSATARFKGVPVDMDLVRESLRDILAVRAKQISIDNIQKIVADYYHIPVRELTGKKRNRSFARPRQMAMALAREMTSLSLPEIGDAFDGRDHTTVLHACRTVAELRQSDARLDEDYVCLQRTLQA